jgi:hypothetical protein
MNQFTQRAIVGTVGMRGIKSIEIVAAECADASFIKRRRIEEGCVAADAIVIRAKGFYGREAPAADRNARNFP